MFKIVDGREYFYQWDLDRQVAVEDSSIVEVHFCNRTDDCSLVVEVVDGVANVPNIILQKNFDVRVFGYDGKATRYDKVFKVKPRTKPADYVYTETELKSYEYLVNKIDEIERNGVSEEVITEAVEDYLERNPVDLTGYATEDYVDEAIKSHVPDIDFTGLATEEYVDKAIENIDIPEPEKVDLTGYATEKYVDTAIANIDIPEVDLTGYATENYVKNAIANAELGGGEGGSVDLSGYATKDDIKNFITEVPAEYVTETELADAIAGIEIPEEADLTNYYTKEETDTLLSNINECDTYFFDPRELVFDVGINNNAARLSDHMTEFTTRLIAGESVNLIIYEETLSRYLPAEFVVTIDGAGQKIITFQRAISAADIFNEALNTSWRIGFSNKENCFVVTRDDEGTYRIASVTYVDDAIAAIEIPEGQDLSKYALKTDIPDVSDFISEIPSEYITESELEAKGYATGGYVDSKVAGIVIPDLTPYAKKTDIPTVPTKVSQLTNDSNYLTEIPSEYITETELNNKGYLTQHQSLDGKADKVHEHTEYADKTHKHSMADITDYEAPEIPSLDGYATEKYVDDAIQNIDIPEGGTPLYQHTIKAEFTKYLIGGRSKPHIYVTLLDTRQEAFTLTSFFEYLYETQRAFSVSGNLSYTSKIYPIDFIRPISSTEIECSYRSSDAASPELIEIENTEACNFSDTVVELGSAATIGGGGSADLSNYYTKAEVNALIPETPDLTGYATKQYVDSLFEGIATAEGGAY